MNCDPEQPRLSGLELAAAGSQGKGNFYVVVWVNIDSPLQPFWALNMTTSSQTPDQSVTSGHEVCCALADANLLVEQVKAHWPDVLAVYLFGSQATGQATAESDLDLAVLLPGYAQPLQLWEVASQLAAQRHCDVDLVDLRAASTVMQYQIVMTGRCLYARGVEADLYACHVLSEKIALDEARQGLIEDILKQGTVYGR